MDIILFGIVGGMAGALLALLFSKRRCPQCNIRFPRFGGGTKKLPGGNSVCLNCGCEMSLFGQKAKTNVGGKSRSAIPKRLAFGAVWCIGFYYAATFGTAMIAGAIAGYRDPVNASSAGGAAGARAVAALQGYILIGSLLVSTIGAVAGWLPGTRVRRPSDEPSRESEQLPGVVESTEFTWGERKAAYVDETQ